MTKVQSKKTAVPAPTPEMLWWLNGKLSFLDSLLRMGETTDEIDHVVRDTGKQCSVIFFAWLAQRNLLVGAEVLAGMVEGFFEDTYLVHWSSHASLAKVSERQLEEFIQLLEFVVSQKMWDRGINPFDGLLLFYQFLEEAGYPADLPRRKRAVSRIRRRVVKQPHASRQPGFDLTH